MTKASRLLLALLAAALPLACEPPEPGDKVSLSDIGDPCRNETTFCLDEGSVQQCIDEVWALTTCEAVCAELGPAYVSEGCNEDDDCVCVLADPSGCTPGTSACSDADTVEVCDGAQVWQATACVEVCASFELASAGCEPATEPDMLAGCICTLEGTPCEASTAPLCADEATLASCVADLWTFEACELVCGGPGSCSPWTTPHSCQCE